MVNVLALIYFVLATVFIALGGVMLYRYWKYTDKVTGNVTKASDGTYKYLGDGKMYSVEKSFGFMELDETKSYTIMMDKIACKAYVLPFNVLDYRYVAGVMILFGMIPLILGFTALLRKQEKSDAGYYSYDGSYDGSYEGSYEGSHDGSCGGEQGMDYVIYGI